MLKCGMGFVDHLKFYINPQIFKAEKDAKEGKTDGYTKVNAEFDYQSHMGTATGKLKSRKYVRDAIEQFYSDRDNPNVEKEVIVLDSSADLSRAAQEASQR